MDYKITHDKEKRIFYTLIDGKESFLRYSMYRENVMDFLTTYVPPALRGKGIAAVLVEEGFKFARENNFYILPTCSYVDIYLQRKNEYKDLEYRG